MSIPPLTNSEMSQFLNCRRGWWLGYYRKLQRKHDLPSLPNIGNLYHAGLEGYYNGTLDDPVIYVVDLTTKLIEEHPELAEQISKDAEMAEIMLSGYLEWVEEEGVDVGLRVIGAEESVEVALEGGYSYRLRGKIDTRLERESDGALLQLEHKTVGDLSRIPKYAQAAPQFLTYDLLAFMLAQKEQDVRATDGVIINMARRVKRTSTAKPPFYGRYEVRHNIQELRAHWKHVVGIGQMIEATRDALDAGGDPQIICPPRVNESHTWSCKCAPLTPMFDDGSDVEGYLQDVYEEYDPWARYEDKQEEEVA